MNLGEVAFKRNQYVQKIEAILEQKGKFLTIVL